MPVVGSNLVLTPKWIKVWIVKSEIKPTKASFRNSSSSEKILFITLWPINKNIITINNTFTQLSSENNFYGIIAKLELIRINIEQKNNQEAISIYFDLLNNNNLNSVYKSAIASKAAYQFIDLNFTKLSLDYSETIKDFISFINEELPSYQSIKLELVYLSKILEAEKNSIKYKNFKEANDIYISIISSDLASSSTKERVNKIHEFFSNK